MLALALILANTTPITKIGNTCPFGYYSASGYCVPFKSLERSTQSIPRTSTTCPFNTYKSGNYCTWSPKN